CHLPVCLCTHTIAIPRLQPRRQGTCRRMTPPSLLLSTDRAPAWKIGLGLTAVYLAWGTSYLAIQIGVRELPPGLFGGVRVCMGGLVVLAWLVMTGRQWQLARPQIPWVIVTGCLMFLGGNGLVTFAEKTVPSGVASVLIATTPLWM